jgi:hypothetical protein
LKSCLPATKDSRNALRTFTETAADILNQNVNLLVVDLFPPTARDPTGIHKAIWAEFKDEPFEAPPGKPLTVASYLSGGGDSPTAYVEPVAVGDMLPSLPIFLSETGTSRPHWKRPTSKHGRCIRAF